MRHNLFYTLGGGGDLGDTWLTVLKVKKKLWLTFYKTIKNQISHESQYHFRLPPCADTKCRQKPLMPSHHPLRHNCRVVRNSHFFEHLETFLWRREWVKAVLCCLHQKEAIAPPDQPIHLLQALEYLEMLGLKIARGMKHMQFEET